MTRLHAGDRARHIDGRDAIVIAVLEDGMLAVEYEGGERAIVLPGYFERVSQPMSSGICG